MKPEQQRIAIAEACGWRVGIAGGQSNWHPVHGGHNSNGFNRNLECDKFAGLPNYLNDLNAMHEAEKSLDTRHKRNRYIEELGRIWTGHKDRAIPDWWFIHEATTDQRAEAFLRTLNLWKE